VAKRQRRASVACISARRHGRPPGPSGRRLPGHPGSGPGPPRPFEPGRECGRSWVSVVLGPVEPPVHWPDTELAQYAHHQQSARLTVLAYRLGVMRVIEDQITALRPYNARYTGDHRSIFRKSNRKMITRVSAVRRERRRPLRERHYMECLQVMPTTGHQEHRAGSARCMGRQHVRKRVSERDSNPHGCDLRRCSPAPYRQADNRRSESCICVRGASCNLRT